MFRQMEQMEWGLPMAPRSVHQQESAPELTPNPGSQGKQETPTPRVYKIYHMTMISFQDIRKCMFIFPLLIKKKSKIETVIVVFFQITKGIPAIFVKLKLKNPTPQEKFFEK